MDSAFNELRLAVTVGLNAVVLLSIWRFASVRLKSAGVPLVLDVFLLYFAFQYVVVGLLGIAGILSAWSIVVLSLMVCGGLWALSASPMAEGDSNRSSGSAAADTDRKLDGPLWVLVPFLFVVGYLAAIVHHQGVLPIMSIDALSYHVPAAVQWLQTGRLGLYEIWYYNPANTYSPLGGSLFIAWLLAPMGNDSLARFVQVVPLLAIFFGMVEVGRRLGASAAVAALIAVAAVLSRPLVSHVHLPKDDLFLAAFFLIAVHAGSKERMAERFGPWRLGLAVGLLLATKYTALLTLPVLLLLIDQPIRAGWRWKQWMIAAALPVLIAGPWYVRNWVLTGNPLYPMDVAVGGVTVFEGMFKTGRSEQLQTFGGFWKVMTRHYHSVPPIQLTTLALLWLGGIAISFRHLLREPMVRLCAVGPIIGFGLFALLSPYPEIRFVYPSLLLMLAMVVRLLVPVKFEPLRVGLAAVIAVVALSTGTAPPGEGLFAPVPAVTWWFVAVGTLVSVVATGFVLAYLLTPTLRRPLVYYPLLVIGVLVAVAAYVYWNGYLNRYRTASEIVWQRSYGSISQVWSYVRDELPPGSTIAYANTYLTYPLFGDRLQHRVIHAPTGREIDSYLDLPHFPQIARGENIAVQTVEVTGADPDREKWLQRLEASGAEYLVIGKEDVARFDGRTVRPPELEFAESIPRRFTRLFENEAGAIFRIEQAELSKSD